jgi:glycosyltransferase involved in cell wall biosynthesis
MNRRTDISVVVCTYNRADLLERALQSLVIQQCPPGLEYEIIVVDDGSTDRTTEVVREAKRCTDRRVVYVRENGRGISAVRNTGVHAARSEWIAFTDDDQIAEPTWLWNLWFAQAKASAQCVGGARTLELPEKVLQSLPRQTRLILGEIPCVGDLQPCTRDSLLCTGNLLLKKDLIQKVGGFDESLTQGGEDTELLMRLRGAGVICWFTPHAVVRHIIPPYRLESGYLTWASTRGGDCFAVRDVREWGRWTATMTAVARVGQAAMIHFPRLVWHRLLGHDAEYVAGKCRCVRAMAYAKRVVAVILAGNGTAKQSTANVIEFRGERQMFDRAAG